MEDYYYLIYHYFLHYLNYYYNICYYLSHCLHEIVCYHHLKNHLRLLNLDVVYMAAADELYSMHAAAVDNIVAAADVA